MTSQWLLDEVAAITENNLKLLKQKFEGMSEKQLSWKPSAQSWSILEIFAHLNEYARYYHEAFLARIEKTRFRTHRANFVSSPLGRSAWQSMKLGNARNVKRKFNAPKNFNPSVVPSIVDGDVMATIKMRQNEIFTILEKSMEVSLRKVKVPISISKIIRLRLGDALLFVAYHNERHFQQALNVTKLPGFPKK